MKTNNEMLYNLKNWYPEELHFIGEEEVEYLNKALELKERSTTDLRNLRDFTVLHFGRNLDHYMEEKDWDGFVKEEDKMSAICGVIDHELFNRGQEV